MTTFNIFKKIYILYILIYLEIYKKQNVTTKSKKRTKIISGKTTPEGMQGWHYSATYNMQAE